MSTSPHVDRVERVLSSRLQQRTGCAVEVAVGGEMADLVLHLARSAGRGGG